MRKDIYYLGKYSITVVNPEEKDLAGKVRQHNNNKTTWEIVNTKEEGLHGMYKLSFLLEFFPLSRKLPFFGKEILPSFISYFFGSFIVTVPKHRND